MGQGPVLVCQPGGPGGSGDLFGDLAGLGDHLTLVLLDPRGAGASDRPADNRAYRLEDYAADIDELREHLGLERISLLGHSHGGFVAGTYAAECPERIEKLLLVTTLARFTDDLRASIAAATERRRHQPWFADAVSAREERMTRGFGSDEELASLWAREYRLTFARDDVAAGVLAGFARGRTNGDALRFFNEQLAPSYDLRPALARISAPTLLIAGREDLFEPAASRDIAAAAPGAEIVVLPSVGHWPWAEDPERFREEVLRFLAA